ncbi:MAG: hypothetical protein QM539_07720 [Alphaproteobacteria bacterium]|nr:hypothetical protein [Alphaproteobacteria bacterium]
MKKIVLSVEDDLELIVNDILSNCKNIAFEFTKNPNEIFDLKINRRGISYYPDWSLESMPLVYTQNIPLTKQNLSLVLQIRDENYDQIIMSDDIQNSLFSFNLEAIQQILQQAIVYEKLYDKYIANSQFEEYAIQHNKAIITHYHQSFFEIPIEDIIDNFKHASYLAPDPIWMSYTEYFLLIFYLETESIEAATACCYAILRRKIPPQIQYTFLITLFKNIAHTENAFNNEPIITDLISFTENFIIENPSFTQVWKSSLSQYYQNIAAYEKAYEILVEALQYLNQEAAVELAKINKQLGDLSLILAQRKQTNTYTQAIRHYQESFKVFTKANYPLEYAHLQMNLGIIYTEIPQYENKKDIYAGLAQSAFAEALHIYNKFEQPLLYASLCINMANAMLRMLPNIDAERFKKIEFYILEALDIRVSSKYPEERAVALVSYINLYFHLIETAETEDPSWLTTLKCFAEEVLNLTHNEFLVARAHTTLEFIQNAGQ